MRPWIPWGRRALMMSAIIRYAPPAPDLRCTFFSETGFLRVTDRVASDMEGLRAVLTHHAYIITLYRQQKQIVFTFSGKENQKKEKKTFFIILEKKMSTYQSNT